MISHALNLIRQTGRRRAAVLAAQAAVRALPPADRLSLHIAALRAVEAAQKAKTETA